MINWNTTREIYDRITKIAQRAHPSLDYQTLHMDLTAVHLNGNPLDLDKLLNSAFIDFDHDVCGITNKIDRETGKLRDCFVPRCSV